MKRETAHISIIDRLAALGDLVRLRVLRVLETEAFSVGEVAKVVQLPQSTVSRHLKVLADAQWVIRRNEGTATFYRLLLDDLSPDARALWLTVRDQMGSGGDVAEDQRRLRTVLADRRTDSLSFFGRFSGEWDHLRNELFGGRFTAHALLSFVARDWTVADLGCGTGNVSELLAPVAKRVIAVDVSAPMLAAARERLRGADNVEFIQSPIDAVPLADRSIDAAVCALVLHHLPNPALALVEVRRLLRPSPTGGVALFVDMIAHDRVEYRHTMGHQHLGFSREQVRGMLTDAGFSETTYRELPGEPDAKGPGLFVAMGRVS